MNQPESFAQTPQLPLAAATPVNGRDTCTPSASDVVLPSLTLDSPSDVSNAGSITAAEDGDDSRLNDVLAAGSVAAAGVEDDSFLNFLTMLDEAVPDTSFVTKDVPSPSPPVCIVDSVERDRVVPSDPSVHVYDVPVSTTSSSSYGCPICPKSFKTLCSSPPSSLWQHLNSFHIARGQFPPISFIISHSRLKGDKKGCHWIYHSRFQRHGCPRPANHGSSKCGGALVCPSTLAHIVFPPDPLPCPPSGNISAALGVSPSIPSQKHPSSLLALALHAASTLSFPASYSSSESDCVFTLFNAIMTTHVSMVKHIPRACRSAFGEVLAQELRWANSGSIWGAIRLFLLAKCILRPPSQGGRRRFHATASLINNRIHQWQNGEIESLWLEASESTLSHTSRLSDSKSSNSRRCLQLAREGQYSKAIRALDSKGVAAPGDPSALQDLSGKHPSSPVVPSPAQVQHSMSVDTNQVFC